MRTQRERGAVAIEFALILPFFVVMVLGMIDYGWYFYIDLVATNAAREGARAASTIPGVCPNAQAIDVGRSAVGTYLAPTNFAQYATVNGTCTTVTPSPTSGPQPSFQFTVQMNFPRLTGSQLVPMPQAPGGAAGNVGMTVRSTMRGVP